MLILVNSFMETGVLRLITYSNSLSVTEMRLKGTVGTIL